LATLLIIDDSEASRTELRTLALESGWFSRVIEAAGGAEGLRLMASERPGVVVCNLELPDFDAEQLIRSRTMHPSLANVPILVVTAGASVERRTRLLERGAADVITKPYHGPEIAARMQLHLKIRQLQDELRVKNQTLARLSTVDAVTGLRNRRYISDLLAIEFQKSKRYGEPLSVVMMDLDYFKRVNDTHGHLSGDAVLEGVAKHLQACLRSTDVAGRYGGEEFLAVLNHSAPEGAAVMAERLRIAIENAVFEAPTGQPIQVTVSMGIAGFDPKMVASEEVIGAADRALYAAKDAGRNCVIIAKRDGSFTRVRLD